MELVIGADLRSFIYCLEGNKRLLYIRPQPPTVIDSPITILNKSYSADYLWKSLYFYLAVSGKILFADKIDNIRIEENHLNIFTKRARKYTQEFSHLTFFDDYCVKGIPTHLEKPGTSLLEVRDWFNVRSGMKHEYSELLGDSDFVKKIIFYPSSRIDGNHDFKDAVALSYLSSDSLDLYDYSDISARFKVTAMMKEAGIRGARNGRDSLNKDRYKYYAVRLENNKREIITPMKIYERSPLYTFKYDSIFDIINGIEEPEYFERLLRHI